MIDAIKAHAEEIAALATELASHIGNGESLTPLVQAGALIELEDIRARLSRVSEMLAHVAPAK